MHVAENDHIFAFQGIRNIGALHFAHVEFDAVFEVLNVRAFRLLDLGNDVPDEKNRQRRKGRIIEKVCMNVILPKKKPRLPFDSFLRGITQKAIKPRLLFEIHF